MLCKNCGNEIDGSLAFCPHCGTKVESEIITDDYESTLEVTKQESENEADAKNKKSFLECVLIPAEKPSEGAGFVDKALYHLKRYSVIYGSSLVLVVVVVLLVFLLTGNSRDYNKAMELYNNGQYAEASVIFSELEDYEDSEEMANDCAYIQACQLVSASDFEGASVMFKEISDYKDSEEMAELCRIELLYLKYPEVFALILDKEWYFSYSDDSELTVRSIIFKKEFAIMQEAEIDGNGRHREQETENRFNIDEDSINVKVNNDSVYRIPYVINDGKIILADGKFYTPEQVDAAIQGYWKANIDPNSIWGKSLGSAYCVHFNKGSYTMEHASEGVNLEKGYYYYYGPDSGKYKITLGCIEMTNKPTGVNEWFFTIVDGKVALYHYTDRAFKTSRLPGRDGYDF
ncbi:MAG: zinc ribbon domain-containing protein [Clostridia bacterium]|nr:zinc ribbon domain-containing protein [Clostridia bacterium]